jgi:hypothetical protein
VIDLTEEGNMVQVVISNSGSSLPPDFDPRQSQSLGLQIVQTLVQDDLKGELQITSITPPATPPGSGEASAGAIQHGTQALVTFPKRSLKVD